MENYTKPIYKGKFEVEKLQKNDKVMVNYGAFKTVISTEELERI